MTRKPRRGSAPWSWCRRRDGGAEVDHRAARRGDSHGNVVGRRLAPTRPQSFPPGTTSGCAGVDPEVGERDQRRDLELEVRAREVRPHVFVHRCRELHFSDRARADEVPEVELVARARLAGGSRRDSRAVRRVCDQLVGERGRRPRPAPTRARCANQGTPAPPGSRCACPLPRPPRARATSARDRPQPSRAG